MNKLKNTPIYYALCIKYGTYPVTLAFSPYPDMRKYEAYYMYHHDIISTTRFIPGIQFTEHDA